MHSALYGDIGYCEVMGMKEDTREGRCMVLRTQEAECRIIDECCRAVTPAQRQEIAAGIGRLYRQALLRQREKT